jgi:hypothetical protein
LTSNAPSAWAQLSPDERLLRYLTLRQASEQGLTGGRIYDALLLRCAANCGARHIYTLTDLSCGN